jgi:uracil-DNA glycosylase
MQFWDCGYRCWSIFEKQLKANDFGIILTLGVRTLALLNKKLHSSFQVGTISKAEIDGRQYHLVSIYHPSPANPHNHQRNLDFLKSSPAV